MADYARGKTAAEIAARYRDEFHYCLNVSQVGPEALVASGFRSEVGLPALLAVRENGVWRFLPLEIPADLPCDLESGLVFPTVRVELLLLCRNPGSGGFGRILHARQDKDEMLQAREVTGMFDHAHADFLRPDLLLMTYRGGLDQPMIWNCNACWPVHHQVLLQWTGDRFIALGRRMFSDPYLTAQLYLGALERGQDSLARHYVTDPALIGQTRKAMGKIGLVWQPRYDWRERIRQLEMRNWDLLPEALRTPIPPELQTYDFVLTSGQDQVVLRMVRKPEGWRVHHVKNRQP